MEVHVVFGDDKGTLISNNEGCGVTSRNKVKNPDTMRALNYI